MVKYLIYKEKQIPIRVSYSALENFQSETGIQFEEMGQTEEGQKLKYYNPLLFFALESGYKALDKKMEFERKDIPDILDDVMWDFVKVLPEFFPKAEEVKKPRGQRRQESRSKKGK